MHVQAESAHGWGLQSEIFYGFCLVHLGVRICSVLFWVISFLKDRFEKIESLCLGKM